MGTAKKLDPLLRIYVIMITVPGAGCASTHEGVSVACYNADKLEYDCRSFGVSGRHELWLVCGPHSS